MFDDSRTLTLDARTDSELSRGYYDHIQLTPQEIATYRRRKQPPVINNRIQRAIDGIRGVVELRKTDPRALMRNPPPDGPQQNPQAGAGPSPQGTPSQQGPMPPSAAAMAPQGPNPIMGQGGAAAQPPKPKLDAGDVATMTLRFISDTTHFQDTKLDVLENFLIEGCGAAIVEYDGQDVAIEQIRWEEFFYDPRSRRHDFKDARYMGVAKWMYADSVAMLYPDTQEAMADFQTRGAISGANDSTWEDRPSATTPWVDGKQKRVMVVDMYHQTGGKWFRCVFFAGAVLEAGPSPYADDKGRPANPIEACSCYVKGGSSSSTSTSQNDRYGIVKGMRDLQDEINMRRSKALHEINTRQVQQVDASAPPVDVKTVRDEASRPDGVLPTGWNIVPRADVVANNFEMLAEAKSEFERMAPAPSVLGRETKDLSGRAQQINQQAGMTELAPVLGRFDSWETRVHVQMWSRARQYYDGPKWIRVTDDLGAPQYIQINEPVVDPQTGQMIQKNRIAEAEVDIILDKVPDTATLDQEVWAELMDLLKAYPPGTIPFALAVEMSPIAKKREILQKLEGAAAQAAPQQQMQMQAQMAQFSAELEKLKSEIRKNDSQSDLNEATTVKTAMEAHLDVTQRAQLPPGVILNGSGTPVPVMPPPPKVSAGPSQSNGSRAVAGG